MTITHIAGLDVQVGTLLRQRCAWCGTILEDYDLERVAVLEGHTPRPATWTVGALVAVDGGAAWIVDHANGDQLPDDSCTRHDPETTARPVADPRTFLATGADVTTRLMGMLGIPNQN